MSKSNYLEDEIIKHIFRTGSFVKPTNLYVALFTADPTDADSGTEVAGGSYARVQTGPADAEWTATVGGDGETSNVNAVTFPAPTGDWGQATHFGICDASAAGNLLYHGPLTQNKTINNGDSAPSFPGGALTVTES
jgi:hypothetical protein